MSFRVPFFLFAIFMISTMSGMTGEKTHFDRLTGMMTGSFDSSKQAAEDDAYYNINLEMHRIWEDRADGYWLYVEQAMSTRLEKPYRQRVYHVTEDEKGRFVSVVYTLPNEDEFVGAHTKLELFDQIQPKDLTVREGCAVVLEVQQDGTFVGSTVEDQCQSSLRGASYATSEIHIYADRMVSWDRGFDSQKNQVWGAEKGGYIFVRK